MEHPAARHPEPERLLDHVAALQEQVESLNRALDHQGRLATLGTIAGLIAHEFNNILTPVASYAQMALASPEDRELAHKAIEKALEGSERAAKIADAILAFAKDDPPPAPVGGRSGRRAKAENAEGAGESSEEGEGPRAEIDQGVRETMRCLARSPSQDGIRVELSLQPGCSAAMPPVALQHVLLNLLLNARNALVPGGGRLAVSAELVDDQPPVPLGAVCSADGSTWNGLLPSLPLGPRPPASEAPPSPPPQLAIAPAAPAKLGSAPAGPVPSRSDSAPDDERARPLRGGRWVVLRIEDSGRGIPASQIARIFDPFFTLSTRTRAKGAAAWRRSVPFADLDVPEPLSAAPSPEEDARQGTGLGMTLCKRLIDSAGGWIAVQSEEGVGTCVTLVLPAATPASQSLKRSA